MEWSKDRLVLNHYNIELMYDSFSCGHFFPKGERLIATEDEMILAPRLKCPDYLK